MALFAQSVIEWTGWEGAPGYTVLSWQGPGGATPTESDVVDWHDALETALTSIGSASFASPVTWTIQNDAAIKDVASGALDSVITDPQPVRTLTCTGDNRLSRATQVGLAYATGVIRNGRRLQGRTFLGPTASGTIGTDGLVTAVFRASASLAWSALTNPLGGHLCVWGRPAPGPGVGVIAPVTAISVPSKPFILRSRRD